MSGENITILFEGARNSKTQMGIKSDCFHEQRYDLLFSVNDMKLNMLSNACKHTLVLGVESCSKKRAHTC